MENKGVEVVGIGNAIVDVLTHADDALLERESLTKGSMRLIDAAEADALYARLGPGVEISGGSAANTMAGLASLGSRGAFIGKVRDDQLGQVFRHDMRAVGVTFDSRMATDGPATPRNPSWPCRLRSAGLSQIRAPRKTFTLLPTHAWACLARAYLSGKSPCSSSKIPL